MAQAATQGDTVQEIAQAVARIIQSHAGGATGISARSVNPDTGTTGISGTFSVGIVLNGTTYTLSITIPTSAGGPYTISVMQGTTTLGSFSYTDASDWTVSTNLSIPLTTTMNLTLDFSITDGNG